MGNSGIFGLHDFSKIEIYFFSPKKVSGDRHGSVEILETHF